MDRLGSNPTINGEFIQLYFIPLLHLPFRRMGAGPRWDFTSPKMALCHHK